MTHLIYFTGCVTLLYAAIGLCYGLAEAITSTLLYYWYAIDKPEWHTDLVTAAVIVVFWPVFIFALVTGWHGWEEQG